MSIMKVGVFYCTFLRDKDWLEYSLQSVKKYASGFSGITIAVPTNDIDQFLPFERRYSKPDFPVLVKTFLEYPGQGFVHHEAMICSADIFMSGMTHILHMDPDVLFTSPVTPLDYFKDGKPVLLVEPFEAIRRDGHTGRYGWKAVVEKALKFPVSHETMCRHPAIHHKWIYKAMREHIESRHEIPFVDYVLRQKNAFPQEFCEFNTLGAYAMEFAKDQYHFIDRGFDREKNDPTPKTLQLWSYTGANSHQNQEVIKKILS
jgi:hypothetical protein